MAGFHVTSSFTNITLDETIYKEPLQEDDGGGKEEKGAQEGGGGEGEKREDEDGGGEEEHPCLFSRVQRMFFLSLASLAFRLNITYWHLVTILGLNCLQRSEAQ